MPLPRRVARDQGEQPGRTLTEDERITLRNFSMRWNARINVYEYCPFTCVHYVTMYYRFRENHPNSNVYVFLDNIISSGNVIRHNREENPETQYSFKNLDSFKIEGAPEFECECSICLGELSIGSLAIRLPNPCSHVYHQDCIIKWLNMSNTCPLCRRRI